MESIESKNSRWVLNALVGRKRYAPTGVFGNLAAIKKSNLECLGFLQQAEISG
jgi:hypothetical protein